jgi:hypothetical protein
MPVLALIRLLLDCQRSARLMKGMMLLSKSADTPASRFPGETVSTHNGGVDDRIFIEIFRSLDRQQLSKFQPGSIDSALHRARRTSAHLRSLVVRKSGTPRLGNRPVWRLHAKFWKFKQKAHDPFFCAVPKSSRGAGVTIYPRYRNRRACHAYETTNIPTARLEARVRLPLNSCSPSKTNIHTHKYRFMYM